MKPQRAYVSKHPVDGFWFTGICSTPAPTDRQSYPYPSRWGTEWHFHVEKSELTEIDIAQITELVANRDNVYVRKSGERWEVDEKASPYYSDAA